MTKVKIAMNSLQGFKKVFRAGYCDLQYIYKYDEPQYYNCGVYGWNCDIYVDYKRDIAITTGYRNMRGECIPSDLLEKYSVAAENIMENLRREPFSVLKEALEENKEKFLNELDNL